MLSQIKPYIHWRQACAFMCLCGRVARLDASGVVCKVHVEMEDNAIPEEYFTCHGDMLFDLLASALVDFAKRHGRCVSTCLWLPDVPYIPLKSSDDDSTSGSKLVQ